VKQQVEHADPCLAGAELQEGRPEGLRWLTEGEEEADGGHNQRRRRVDGRIENRCGRKKRTCKREERGPTCKKIVLD
jgi:hypothetical protein